MSSVLITDSVHAVCADMLQEAGIEPRVELGKSPEELAGLAVDVDGWIIRSGTRITAPMIQAAEKLRVIGRAGVGVDNVDLTAATHRGVLVINAPAGNTISTAEHTVAMLMSLARQIPAANASLRSGAWERKKFSGSEVFEKTLGVIGVGKIGQAVAERMQSFGMRIVGFDPVLSPEVAERLGIELVDLEEMYRRADYITVHTPLNDATRGLLNADTLSRCKPGVGLVNCARGGIIDEADLLEALESGQVGGAALDVFSKEPPPEHLRALIEHPRVVATPHIAASTGEAQEKVARQVTEQVIHALRDEPVLTAVNAMAIRMAAQPEVQPYLELAEQLGRIANQLSDGAARGLIVRCHGEVARHYKDVLLVAALKGIMRDTVTEQVNLVNAPVLSEEAGLKADVQTFHADGSYTNLVEVVLTTTTSEQRVTGTVFGRDDVRIVRVDDSWIEVKPEGALLFYRNVDRPGMLAHVGGILADRGINIGALALGRSAPGAIALTAISVDEPVEDDALSAIRDLDGVTAVRHIQL
ncbi:MAG: phosphoglycerate dehydrogenase [Rhodothermales bacterium]|nr:phosphoglycerate dehydrogenase [Rhodothermales bacterium]MBO6779644.1 phosphoglycerate dehydrogenase [Rhodothermales bacterium]